MQRFFPKLVKKEWLILLGIVILYLGLTTYNLTKLPIFVDEALYLRWSQIAWKDASWRFISLTDGKQPFYIWFVIPFLKVFKDKEILIIGRGRLVGQPIYKWLVKENKRVKVIDERQKNRFLCHDSWCTLALPLFLLSLWDYGVYPSRLGDLGCDSLNSPCEVP